MNILLTLLSFYVIRVSDSNEREENVEDVFNVDKFMRDKSQNDFLHYRSAEPDYAVNIIGLGKDDHEDRIRPCALEDWQCIREFFAGNSKCTPSYGPVPDPLKLDRITQYYPFANMTVIQTEFSSTGLGKSKISEFYVNENTGNLVIAIDFKDLNETSPKAYFRYKRTAKESIVLVDYTSVLYSSGKFTAVIPKIPHLRLDLAEAHIDIDDAVPAFIIGPAAINSTDPDVLASFTKFSSDIPTAIQEAFLFKSQLYVAIYIQQVICDFGLHIISI